MPATIVFYREAIAPPKTILYESPNKNYIIYQRYNPLYSNPECTDIIGNQTTIYTTTFNVDDEITSVKLFLKFNEISGVPYGDDNILVVTNTRVNKINGDIFIKNIYTGVVSTNESTGEYANQTGYYNYYKTDSEYNSYKYEVFFPLPIVTYTNAFNSLPQPSTAPLPA
jgi:hypothetical protein